VTVLAPFILLAPIFLILVGEKVSDWIAARREDQ
jgi:hypothetical protein